MIISPALIALRVGLRWQSTWLSFIESCIQAFAQYKPAMVVNACDCHTLEAGG